MLARDRRAMLKVHEEARLPADAGFGGRRHASRGCRDRLRVAFEREANEGRPAYSPDGTWVAFTSDRTGTSQIYVGRYGAPATRITDSKHGDGAPAWSPDGARIVFARLSGEDWPDPESTGLFVANRDGSGLRQLTTGDDYAPCWLADGKTIVFARGLMNEELFIVDADGSNPRRLRRDADAASCSPSEPIIAFADGASISVLDLATGRERVLARSRDAVEHGSPAWSLDGRWLAFEAERPRTPSDPVIEEGPWAAPWYYAEIYLVASDGTGLERLTDNSVGDRWPTWLPDGHILFLSNREGPNDLTNADASNLYVMNTDGTEIASLVGTRRPGQRRLARLASAARAGDKPRSAKGRPVASPRRPPHPKGAPSTRPSASWWRCFERAARHHHRPGPLDRLRRLRQPEAVLAPPGCG